MAASAAAIRAARNRERMKLRGYTRIGKEGFAVILCDWCGQAKECLQKEIDGREFDICAACWQPLEEKLKGKGRVKRKRETVFLPPQTVPQPELPKTPPGLPPKIIGGLEHAN